MGFPATNIEGVYRNNIDDVSRLLEAKHHDHYKIYNLCSERSYDTSKFHNRVEVYPFDDHNPPKIELIEPFCEDVHRWLMTDTRNVAAVHCKAGKGRTGTMICCYLLHSRQCSTAEEALSYYGAQRTRDCKGVTIPSQLRYVNYYANIVQGKLKYMPVSLYINTIVLEPPPIFAGGQGCICFSISQQNADQLKRGKKCSKVFKSDIYEVKRGSPRVEIVLDSCSPITGDIKVEFFNKKIRKERQFQFWFNTFFVANCRLNDANGLAAKCGANDMYVLTLRKNELDIVNKKDKQNKIFTADFRVSYNIIFSYMRVLWRNNSIAQLTFKAVRNSKVLVCHGNLCPRFFLMQKILIFQKGQVEIFVQSI